MASSIEPTDGSGIPEKGPGNATPTVYNVAAHAGVSIATVSRVLRRPDDVSASTAARVMDSVRALDYVPSNSARGLASKRAGAVGICFPGFDDAGEIDPAMFAGPRAPVRIDAPNAAGSQQHQYYFSEVTRGVELEAWRNSMTVTLAFARGARADEILEDVAGGVDALVTLAGAFSEERLAHIARRIPVAVVAGKRSVATHDHISVANRDGMRTLTNHLIVEHGIRNLAFVGGAEESPDGEERFAGFRDALEAARIPLPETPLRRGDFTQPEGHTLGSAIVASHEVPRALVCANDQTALGVLDALHEAGLRVPKDVVVTGFDGVDATRHSFPRLTTVEQPMIELGRVAVNVLQSRIKDPAHLPQSLILPVEVLARESCGCRPRGPALSAE